MFFKQQSQLLTYIKSRAVLVTDFLIKNDLCSRHNSLFKAKSHVLPRGGGGEQFRKEGYWWGEACDSIQQLEL